MTVPIIFTWQGDVMVPLERFSKLCNREFVVGESYPLVIQEARSAETHRHYFACIAEAWKNLPENVAERWPTSEHLRKWALVQAGFRDERSIVCASKAEALRVAAFIRPIDEYAVVIVSEATVIEYRAKSQSTRAMGKKEFQDSKQKVLDIVSGLIGVETAHLERATAPSITPSQAREQADA